MIREILAVISMSRKIRRVNQTYEQRRLAKGHVKVQCPECNEHIWGRPGDIDSGLRKHLDYCVDDGEDGRDG